MELKPAYEIFANELIVNKGNLTSAYAKAYPTASYKSCRQGGWLLSKNVNIQRRLQELMEQNGLGLKECIRRLRALTEADKIHHYNRGVPVIQPDNYVRLQSVQTALKIHVMLGNVQTIGEEGS